MGKKLTKKDRAIAYVVSMLFIIGALIFIFFMIVNLPNVAKYKYLKENGWAIEGTIVDYKEQRVRHVGGDMPGFSYTYLYSIQYLNWKGEENVFYYRFRAEDFNDMYGEDLLDTKIALYIDDRGSIALEKEVATKYKDVLVLCITVIVGAAAATIFAIFVARSVYRQGKLANET